MAKFNLYRALGLIEGVDATVVEAAYRALLIHRDLSAGHGDGAITERRMLLAEEAYETLSDSVRKQDYDRLPRPFPVYAGELDKDDVSPVASLPKPLAADWIVAAAFYPDIDGLSDRLRRLSPSLAYTYQLTLLAGRAFEQHAALATSLEEIFLGQYFGQRPTIRAFARFLIELNEQEAAEALNVAMRVLGDGIAPAKLIDSVCSRYGITTEFEHTRGWMLAGDVETPDLRQAASRRGAKSEGMAAGGGTHRERGMLIRLWVLAGLCLLAVLLFGRGLNR